MTEDDARTQFAGARVARLATADRYGRPHVVPIVFAVDGDVVYSAIDNKPKTTTALKRLDNIATNPNVSLLVDEYDDDWNQLWWVRADGRAEVQRANPRGDALLRDRYPQYADQPTFPAIMAVTITRWRGWRAS